MEHYVHSELKIPSKMYRSITCTHMGDFCVYSHISVKVWYDICIVHTSLVNTHIEAHEIYVYNLEKIQDLLCGMLLFD